MTCILSLLTDDYVIQVSDRRLTKAGRTFNEPLRVVDDHANKAVFLDARFAFSYTGLAWFRGKPSEEWLAHLWANDGEDLTDSAKRFRRCAVSLTAEFRQLGWNDSIKRLAYIGVGWIGDGTGAMKPAMIVVTNYHGPKDWLDKAEIDFKLISKVKPKNSSYYLHQSGVGIPDENWRALNRDIRRMVDHNVSPERVSVALVDFIILVAENDKSVGYRCMITCIPRSVVPSQPTDNAFYSNGMPRLDCRTFFYVDGPYTHWPQIGPILAAPGIYMSGFKTTGPGSGFGFGDPGAIDA